MDLQWTSAAQADLARLYNFLAAVNQPAAARVAQTLAAAPINLLATPRLGNRLDQFRPREVRRVIVGDYEMRYEIRGDVIFVLRLWHGREDR